MIFPMTTTSTTYDPPEFDWGSYYDELEPTKRDLVYFWTCHCLEVNASVTGNIAQCVGCRLIHFAPEAVQKPVL